MTLQLTKPLSDKLSEFLEQSLEDFTEILQNSDYDINMSTWYSGQTINSNKCEVCLGGSVLAKRTNLSLRDFFEISILKFQNPDLYRKVTALDFFRRGGIGIVDGMIAFFPESRNNENEILKFEEFSRNFYTNLMTRLGEYEYDIVTYTQDCSNNYENLRVFLKFLAQDLKEAGY